MTERAYVGVGVAILVLLTGCADEAPAITNGGGSTTAAPPIVSNDTGSITGIVTDEELVPLPGADVALQGPAQASAQADPEGRFTFNELPPGSYVVNALRLGYEQAAKRIDVAAGAASNVSIALAALAVASDPYIDYKIHEGMITGPSFYCFCLIVLPTSHSIVLNLTQGVQEIVGSMAWQVNQPTSTRYLGLIVRHPDTGTAKETNSTSGVSPLTTKIEELDIKKEKDKAAIVYTIDFLCKGATFTPQCLAGSPDALVPVIVYQQRVKVYSSVFYNQEAPDGYTGLPP